MQKVQKTYRRYGQSAMTARPGKELFANSVTMKAYYSRIMIPTFFVTVAQNGGLMAAVLVAGMW